MRLGGEQPLLPRPGIGAVQGAPKAAEHFLDLVFAYDQGRTDRNGIAGEKAGNHAFLLSELHRSRSDGAPRIESATRGLVTNQLDSADEADAARLADQRMIAERAQQRLEARRLGGGGFEHAVARIDFQRLER